MKVKAVKIVLDGYGSFLGMEKGCFIVRDRNGTVERYPLFEHEIGEVQIKTGNMVSSGALSSCGFWGIDVLILTGRGNPVAMLKSLDDDSHVKTRLCQYEAFKTKRLEIAKKFVLGKVEGQNELLKKYGLRPHRESLIDRIPDIRDKIRLLNVEGKCSRAYFGQVFGLFEEALRPKKRKKFKAYDGLNNLLNLAYTMLKWKVHIALIKAKLEPYLGFLHSVQYAKPSLVCDFAELYRYLIDDFLVQYCQRLKKSDFVMKSETYRNRRGKREYLNDTKTRDFMRKLNAFFQSTVDIPRIRIGKRQEIETLVREEAWLFAKYLRKERKTWNPRIVNL